MAWRAVAATGDEAGFTPSEQRTLQAIANSTTGLTTKLTTSIRMFVGALAAARYPVNNNDTVPDQLRPHILAWAIWDFVTSFPALKSMATPERKAKRDDAQKIYERICLRTYGAIEPPGGVDITTGSWNSEVKLVMRTHPIPQPALQFQQTAQSQPSYANPNAPTDTVPTASPGVPNVPINLQAVGGQGSVTLTWDPSVGAASYTVYRGLGPGQELAAPLASNVIGSNYLDAGLAAGQAYYYQIVAVNGGLVSQMTGEVSAVPK